MTNVVAHVELVHPDWKDKSGQPTQPESRAMVGGSSQVILGANKASTVEETSEFENYGADTLVLEDGLATTQEEVHTVLVDVMSDVMVAGESEEPRIVLPSDGEEVAGNVLSNPNWFDQMKSAFQVCIFNISIF